MIENSYWLCTKITSDYKKWRFVQKQITISSIRPRLLVQSHSYYSQDMHGPYEMFDLGDFVLEEGYTLRDCQLCSTLRLSATAHHAPRIGS